MGSKAPNPPPPAGPKPIPPPPPPPATNQHREALYQVGDMLRAAEGRIAELEGEIEVLKRQLAELRNTPARFAESAAEAQSKPDKPDT